MTEFRSIPFSSAKCTKIIIHRDIMILKSWKFHYDPALNTQCTNNTLWTNLTPNPDTIIASTLSVHPQLFHLPLQKRTRQEILGRKREAVFLVRPRKRINDILKNIMLSPVFSQQCLQQACEAFNSQKTAMSWRTGV